MKLILRQFSILAVALIIGFSAIAQSEEIQISGKTLAVVDNGDFVYPKISPDGDQIAYSRVTLKGNMELTEIAVKNLKTSGVTILLTPQASEKYAVYSSFVADLEWLNNNELVASVSDGDVDSTELTFDVRKRKIVKSEESSAGDGLDLLPSNLKFAVKPIQEISPKLSRAVIENSLQAGNGGFSVRGRGVVLQYSYHGYADHIRFFDFQKKVEKTLLEVPDPPKDTPHTRLLGGFHFGENIVFALNYHSTVRIYEHKNNETNLLIEAKLEDFENNSPELSIKYQNSEKILFLIKPLSLSSGKGSLWSYDRNGLRSINDVMNLLDVDIRANRIAFCHWVDNKKRHIVVKELKP